MHIDFSQQMWYNIIQDILIIKKKSKISKI